MSIYFFVCFSHAREQKNSFKNTLFLRVGRPYIIQIMVLYIFCYRSACNKKSTMWSGEVIIGWQVEKKSKFSSIFYFHTYKNFLGTLPLAKNSSVSTSIFFPRVLYFLCMWLLYFLVFFCGAHAKNYRMIVIVWQTTTSRSRLKAFGGGGTTQ